MIEKHLKELLEARNVSPQKWHSLYDQCVWDIVVSSEEELLRIFNQSWAFDLPAPIHTFICQRLALITKNLAIKDEAISLAKIYCNPSEEKNVQLGVNTLSF